MIHTEEAVLISLARLSPFVAANDAIGENPSKGMLIEFTTIKFSDKSLSDESSSDDK